MGKRAVQAASVSHENKQFPKETPGFTADIESLKDLSDAIHNRPNVPKDAKLVVETPNPSGGTWWQRWSDIENLPPSEADPIKIKLVKPRQPPSPKKQQQPQQQQQQAPAGRKKGKKTTSVPRKQRETSAPTPAKKQQREAASPSKKQREAAAAAPTFDDEEEEDFDLVKTHLDAIAGDIGGKDAKLDKVESQMIDAYDNEKKVAVLARIQDRLADHLNTLQTQRTAILVAAMAAEDDTEEEFGYEEYMAQQLSTQLDLDDDDEDDIDDFS